MKQLVKKIVDENGIKVHNDKLYSALYFNPTLRAGEAFVDGWWDCENLDQLFHKLALMKIESQLNKKMLLLLNRLLGAIFNFQTKHLSKQVADVHYNLGNDLYQAMLGKSMAYTCGYWKNANNLDDAQRDKYDLVCRKTNLKRGDKVLDLGCGFGGFAKHAAENYGCEVTGVNISTEQIALARELCKNLPVTFHLTDYRNDKTYNPNGIQYDKVISIGLCEHVGPKNYRAFMELISRNLKDNGLFLLHTIGSDISQTSADPWVRKYIFPNGVLPSIQQLSRAAEGQFVIEDWHNFGADYDKTLMAWFENFHKNWSILSPRYGDKFYRMWKYYLLSCAGYFRARSMQLWQIVLSKNGVSGGYTSHR